MESITPPHLRKSLAFLLQFFPLVLPFTAGCAVSYEKLDAIEKAKLITRYNKSAEDYLRKYIQSGCRDLGLIDKVVECSRITTEISPGGCPECFRRYGFAMSVRGHHLRTLYEDLLEEAEAAGSQVEARELEERAEEYQREMLKTFEISNRSYETYFSSTSEIQIHPWDFERVMRHHELRGEYERALFYLERFVSAYGVQMKANTRENVDKLRRYYNEQLQIQRDQGVKRSLPKPSRRAGAPSLDEAPEPSHERRR